MTERATEFQRAYRLAVQQLEDVDADPDSDLSMLSRQFIRSVERENRLRAGITVGDGEQVAGEEGE
jgi:hypothetical protein